MFSIHFIIFPIFYNLTAILLILLKIKNQYKQSADHVTYYPMFIFPFWIKYTLNNLKSTFIDYAFSFQVTLKKNRLYYFIW